LPAWLTYNSINGVFDVDPVLLELEQPELTNINIVFTVTSASGSASTNPISFSIGDPADLAPAQPVVAPAEPVEPVEEIVQPDNCA
jgi:hypothetical protein